MKKINFKSLSVSTTLNQKEKTKIDITEALGNMLYQTQSTIAMFRLSQKIYDSKDEIELTDQEVMELSEWVKKSNLLLPVKLALAEALGFKLNE